MSAIEAGTPQGSPLSPLLANIALHVLDQAWQSEGRRLGVLVRYADDLVVLCATREQAEAARELVAATLDTLGLRLHPGKTRVVQLARGAEGARFEAAAGGGTVPLADGPKGRDASRRPYPGALFVHVAGRREARSGRYGMLVD